ncbi:hypothetical protein HII13_004795 [Brettanomyces bruxellensis]|nr:hypothetical protein HII13_004795 [Brettanomyces bruxellensis]
MVVTKQKNNLAQSPAYNVEKEVGIDDIFEKLSKIGSEKNKNDNDNKETLEKLKEHVSKLPGFDKADLEDDVKKNKILKKKVPGHETALKRKRTAEWFDLPKTEVTEDMKRELSIIKYRQYLDPKRFYKKDKWEIPERFQMGTIVGGPTDYYNRLTKKQRGEGFIEEILNDPDAKAWFHKTYEGIQKEKVSGGKNYYKDFVAKRKGAK